MATIAEKVEAWTGLVQTSYLAKYPMWIEYSIRFVLDIVKEVAPNMLNESTSFESVSAGDSFDTASGYVVGVIDSANIPVGRVDRDKSTAVATTGSIFKNSSGLHEYYVLNTGTGMALKLVDISEPFTVFYVPIPATPEDDDTSIPGLDSSLFECVVLMTAIRELEYVAGEYQVAADSRYDDEDSEMFQMAGAMLKTTEERKMILQREFQERIKTVTGADVNLIDRRKYAKS